MAGPWCSWAARCIFDALQLPVWVPSVAGLVWGGRARFEGFDGTLCKIGCRKVILLNVVWHVKVDGWAVIFRILY